MSTTILGLMTNKEHQKGYNVHNEKSPHLIEDRASRCKLVKWNSKSLYYFEVFRKESSSRQIHVLLEDATLIVFNRDTGEIITLLLLYPSRLNYYMSYINYGREKIRAEQKLSKCAKLNRRNQVNRVDDGKELSDDRLKLYLEKKNNILERG